MSEVDGATLIARSLKQQGIDHLFGVVGFPITAIAAAAQKEGVAYLGMRNEQSAAYAAAAYGYLTGRPGACVTVTGPGVVHGLSGLANAQQNCWPMILIGGASETYRGGMGAFQEERQVLIASPFCKFAHGIESVARIPFYVEMATRNAIYGRPGATYLDMPDDIIRGTCVRSMKARTSSSPRDHAMPLPSRTSGRWAFSSRLSAASTFSIGAIMRGGSGTRSTSTTLSRSHFPVMMSSGMSR